MKNNILIPRNIEGRQEKLKQKWYKMFTTQEVIDGNIDIKMDLDIDPSLVKTKKINGNVYLRNITKIPQFFKNIEINGFFDCSHNKLTSLRGCPEIVHGNFSCSDNNLTSLEGCPKEVKGNFWCDHNSKQFTVEEVKQYCKVDGKINTRT